MVENYCRQLGDGEEFLSTKLFVLLSFYCAARSCEICYLEFRSITRKDAGLEVTISRAKTDRTGGSTLLVAPKNADPAVCPVVAYDRYAALRPPGATRAFLYFNAGRYENRPVGINILKKLAGEVASKTGQTGRFTSHGFRSGAATTYINHGGSREGLKMLGGWKSDAVCDGYIRHTPGVAYKNAGILGSVLSPAPPGGGSGQITFTGGLSITGCTGVTIYVGSPALPKTETPCAGQTKQEPVPGPTTTVEGKSRRSHSPRNGRQESRG